MTTELISVISRARGLDDATVATITANLPDPASGFIGMCLPGPSRDEVARMRDHDPAVVNAWWRSLSPSQQEQAIRDYPDLVGWLDGVPAVDRDQANRLRLAQDEASLRQRADDLRREIADLRDDPWYTGKSTALSLAQRELNRVTTTLDRFDLLDRRLAVLGNRAMLLGIDPAGDGKAIVSIGNPDTADNVVTYVPGTGSDLSGMRGMLNRTNIMAEDANLFGGGEQTAAILWLGYDAPDRFVNAASDDYADEAAADLSRFQGGLRTTHEGGTPSHNVVLGHSYGTTVVGHTATDAGIKADDLVLVASPGVGTDSASDLGMAPGHVWATTAEHDIIRRVPNWDIAHGAEPTSRDFGANVFASAPGDPDDEFGTHSAYWKEGNAARENIARIIIGEQPTR